MATQILGACFTSATQLNRWLKTKGVPEYAELYKKYGETYGVCWDMAVFQSCLETGFWQFKGDVSAKQNNFAGIGAKGGGVPGDSFASPSEGIAAQLQNLALRSGVLIEKEKIIAPYVKANYGLIKGRGTKTWESLTGTYAADQDYHRKIFAIRDEFRAFAEKETPIVTKKATWIGFGQDPKGHYVQALVGGEGAIETLEGNDNVKLIEFLQRHVSTAKTRQILTARVAPIAGGEKPEEPKPEEPAPVKADWMPFAKRVALFKTKRYPKGWPEGLVVHFTAGNDNAGNTCDYLRSKGYPCIVLAKDGVILQGFPASEGGAHSGTVHHNTCVGIEIVNGGKLTPNADGSGTTWFDKVVPKENCRNFKGNGKTQVSGRYEKYTEAQEAKLIKMCLWYKEMAPDIFSFDRVIGHDEACAVTGNYGRKNDPSGSLSMTMPKFREHLVALWAAGKRSKDY